MKKVIIIAIPFVIGILAILLTIFLNSNKNEVVVKNEKQNVVSTMEDSDYFVEEVVNDKSEKRINQTTKKVKTTTTKTKESVNEVNKTTTSSKASSVLTTTKKDTTTAKTTTTTTTKKITTSTSSCYEGKFHTSFFRSDFKNDDNACFLKGTELSEKTNGKHIFECEYEFDDCGIKHWMLIMYDENDKQYYYKNFEKLYPEYK